MIFILFSHYYWVLKSTLKNFGPVKAPCICYYPQWWAWRVSRSFSPCSACKTGKEIDNISTTFFVWDFMSLKSDWEKTWNIHLGKMKQIQNKYWFSSKFDQTLSFKSLSFVKVWSNSEFQKSEFCQSLIKVWLLKVWVSSNFDETQTFKTQTLTKLRLLKVKLWQNSDF